MQMGPFDAKQRPYHHDCDACVWVGWHHEHDGRPVNIYVCPQHNGGFSLILRYSDDGPDYASYHFSLGREREPGTVGMTRDFARSLKAMFPKIAHTITIPE